MKRILNKRVAILIVASMLLTTLPAQNIKQILKVGGVLVVVNNFGKDMNKAINKLWGREDGPKLKTKVVPIFTVGSGTAIGAAQVMGPPSAVDKVVAVAQPEVKFLGELRLRALIPVSSKNVVENIRAVEEVGVSGIVDIKL